MVRDSTTTNCRILNNLRCTVKHYACFTLFSPLGKLADRAIYFTFRNFFFFLLGAKLSQYLLDRFSRSFHQMEGICVSFLDQVHFFRFLKGRCHGNQFCIVPDLFALSQSISGSAGPIFTIFAPYGRY